MKLSTSIAVLLPAAITAAPSALQTRSGDELCAPTSYFLSDYVLYTSSVFSFVQFTFRSEFAPDALVEDIVQNGLYCDAADTVIPNNNECSSEDVKTRKLLFDLRDYQDQAHYQISHTWVCNNATWMSGNDIEVPTECETTGEDRTCFGDLIHFTPQNVRKLCQTPTC